MKAILTFLISAVIIIGVLVYVFDDLASEKSQASLNATGEKVGKTTTAFIKGVTKGVDETFKNNLELAPLLAEAGISTGQYKVSSVGDGKRNRLSVYLIFDRTVTRQIFVRLIDAEGNEYGRTSATVKGNSGEARYVDFIFNPPTEIERRGTIQLIDKATFLKL